MTAANYAALSFEPWRDAHNAAPPSAVGIAGVLHLISEDIYIDITVTSWGGGEFSYERGEQPTVSALGRGGFALLGSLLVGVAAVGFRRS